MLTWPQGLQPWALTSPDWPSPTVKWRKRTRASLNDQARGDIRSASPTCPSLAPCQDSCPQPSPGLLLTLLTPDSRTQLSVMEGGGQSCPSYPTANPPSVCGCLRSDRPPGRWSGGKTSSPPLPVGAQLVHTTAPGHLGFPLCLQPGISSSGIISHPDIPCFVPELADRTSWTPSAPWAP